MCANTAEPAGPERGKRGKTVEPERQPAIIVVHLPEDARLFVDGKPTRSRSSRRRFETPSLEPGRAAASRRPRSALSTAAAYATLGEMCGVLREVFGEYREPIAV